MLCQCEWKLLPAAPVVMLMWWGVPWHSLHSPPSSLRSPQTVNPSMVNHRAYVCFRIAWEPFHMYAFSNSTIYLAWFSVPFMRFVDESKMGRHIFDPFKHVATRPCVWMVQIYPSNRVATRTVSMNGPDLILKFLNRMNGTEWCRICSTIKKKPCMWNGPD